MRRLQHIDLALLRAFVEVADTGTMSIAAVRLHLTQGAVSQRIKRLEAFLACPLLERDTQGSRLSWQGRLLLPEARRLLRMNDAFCARIQDLESTAPLRLGLPFDMAGAPLAPVLKAFAAAFPSAEVKIFSAASVDITQAFANAELDIALSQGSADVTLGERLAVDRLVWLGDPAAARRRPLPLCFLTANCAFRDSVFQCLEHTRIIAKVVFENSSVDTTLSMVRSELAVTPWLRGLVPEDMPVLDADSGLPDLPAFAVRLQTVDEASAPAAGLALLIRRHFGSMLQLSPGTGANSA